jgi:hypothetical protein
MNGLTLACSLTRIAGRMIADASLDKLESAIDDVSSLMAVGSALKKAGFKYTFVTSPLPLYLVKIGSVKYGIVNRKLATNPDRVVGNLAIGKM